MFLLHINYNELYIFICHKKDFVEDEKKFCSFAVSLNFKLQKRQLVALKPTFQPN